MKRNKWLILLAAVLAGVLLLGAVWFFMDRTGGSQSGALELAPFQSVDLSVMSGDITITEGDTYAIRYQLHGREKVRRAEVVDSTLYFETGFDVHWKPGEGNWSVVLTVPRGSAFDILKLNSVAGDISLSDFDFRDGEFTTVSGDISVSGAECETISASTVSNDIALTDSVISASAELDTVSGGIGVSAPFAAVRAESIGGIRYNGTKQGHQYSAGQGQPELRAVSVSGKITIDTGAGE